MAFRKQLIGLFMEKLIRHSPVRIFRLALDRSLVIVKAQYNRAATWDPCATARCS